MSSNWFAYSLVLSYPVISSTFSGSFSLSLSLFFCLCLPVFFPSVVVCCLFARVCSYPPLMSKAASLEVVTTAKAKLFLNSIPPKHLHFQHYVYHFLFKSFVTIIFMIPSHLGSIIPQFLFTTSHFWLLLAPYSHSHRPIINFDFSLSSVLLVQSGLEVSFRG